MTVEFKKQLKIPEPDPYFFMPQSVIINLRRLNELAKKHPVNVLITGRQGCGKSSLVRQFAARYERPLTIFQVGLLTEPGQLFGQQRLREGETYYQEFLFPQAISTPKCIVHLEEINRPEHPKALNELFSVLGEDRNIWVDELGLAEVAEEVIFFASLNEGPQFTGTEVLDAALRDRFYTIRLDYLPPATEQEVLVLKTGISGEDADKVIRVIHRLRHDPRNPVSISTRHSLMVGELVSAGASLREAFTYTLHISKDALESCLVALHFGSGETETEGEEYELF
ncbi:MAG: MoxR family ATPase [Chloroflexota bacterium]|nr:MoxR family ATPase [Chloroflexota bacterium]